VGGIYANTTYPAEFIYQNLIVEANVVHQAWKGGVKKLLFLGSSCIYPKFADQPIQEESLLTGMLEPTNEPYAIAKIAGIKLCESYNRQYGESHGIDYRSVMPTNLYGPGDNYHPKNSHVIPALIRRFYEAKILNHSSVEVWGSGNARREFLYVDDLAKATIYIHNLRKESYLDVTTSMVSHINIGYGSDVSIAELVEIIVDVIGYKGEIKFDSSMPDGTPRKLMSNEKIKKLGWIPSVDLRTGLELTVKDFINSVYDE
jgi:GDP-L-fucose synthase